MVLLEDIKEADSAWEAAEAAAKRAAEEEGTAACR